ncbi:unnamed protein product [Protopolystoma xenopodis]|uniref:Uncharacterized protein n=1 Tax=Protopolystoma xenopodis TaxID=117903 RepID=A0A448XBZ4_9PLAT|nr:unnamed protein product [Protopolystoma xenopodis]
MFSWSAVVSFRPSLDATVALRVCPTGSASTPRPQTHRVPGTGYRHTDTQKHRLSVSRHNLSARQINTWPVGMGLIGSRFHQPTDRVGSWIECRRKDRTLFHLAAGTPAWCC